MHFDKRIEKRFLKKFEFKKELCGYIGIEREHFLMSPSGIYIPEAKNFLKRICDPRWTYELSACQAEVRTAPHSNLSSLSRELLENWNNGRKCAEDLGIMLVNREVGDADMPLEIYPDPRYLKIIRSIPHERLSAACRVAGTHIHIGVSNIRHALLVQNTLIRHLDEFCAIGDHSGGERLRLYKTMAENWRPIPYKNSGHFAEVARQQEFLENPRNCWQLVRISIHGTVELRMFGVTDNIDEIIGWTTRVRSILKKNGVM